MTAAETRMKAWPHAGFSLDEAMYIHPGDTRGLDRLVDQYVVRTPLSLDRTVKVSGDGTVINRSE